MERFCQTKRSEKEDKSERDKELREEGQGISGLAIRIQDLEDVSLVDSRSPSHFPLSCTS